MATSREERRGRDLWKLEDTRQVCSPRRRLTDVTGRVDERPTWTRRQFVHEFRRIDAREIGEIEYRR